MMPTGRCYSGSHYDRHFYDRHFRRGDFLYLANGKEIAILRSRRSAGRHAVSFDKSRQLGVRLASQLGTNERLVDTRMEQGRGAVASRLERTHQRDGCPAAQRILIGELPAPFYRRNVVVT